MPLQQCACYILLIFLALMIQLSSQFLFLSCCVNKVTNSRKPRLCKMISLVFIYFNIIFVRKLTYSVPPYTHTHTHTHTDTDTYRYSHRHRQGHRHRHTTVFKGIIYLCKKYFSYIFRNMLLERLCSVFSISLLKIPKMSVQLLYKV